MATLVLDTPHHVTVGTVGQPGARTFMVQAEDADRRVTMVAEKQQVAGIGDMVARLLVRLQASPATDYDALSMALREPLEPTWRIAEVELGLDVDAGRILLEFTGMEVDEDAPFDVVAFTINLDQARRLAGHADVLVDQGRPRCRLCGRPMDDDGSHVCPATNGHGRLTV